MHFYTDELVENCVKDLQNMPTIHKARLISQTADIHIENAGVSHVEREFRTTDIADSYCELPDVITAISDATLLTPATVKEILIDSYRVKSKQFAQAIVYNIIDKENPKQERVVSIDGNYTNSRMIGDNLYFISNKYPYYYKEIADEEILPICKDTAAVNSIKRIAATDIAYFPDTESYSYMLVAGFNINNNGKYHK